MNEPDNYSYEEVLELTKQGIEIWRRIVIDGVITDYEVSNLGRIKSLKSGSGSGGKKIGYGSLNKDGYNTKALRYTDENDNKKCKSYKVHRLVAMMFIPNPENKPQIDHINADRTNNRVDNLRWATRQENLSNPNTRRNISKALKGKPRTELTDSEKFPCVTENDISLEIWKPIKGYEGFYEVSNMGRVKGKKDLLLKPTINYGYQIVTLIDENGKYHACRIHQLVAKHFIPNPDNKPYVDHINTNKIDNRHFNLRWVTQKENMNNGKTREKIGKVKMRPVIVLDKKGDVISSGLSVKETAKNIGIGASLLENLLQSGKPYMANVNSDSKRNVDSKLFNGMRAYYIDRYNKEEVLKEIAEDKTDYSYCIGDLICIYTDGRITNPMNGAKLAKELGIGDVLVYKIKYSKKPYKAPIKCGANVSKEYLKHLQTLEGIRIMYYEDYLKEQKNNLKNN